jgi:hypothetical protein
MYRITYGWRECRIAAVPQARGHAAPGARGRPEIISAEPLLADLGTGLDLSGISQIIAGGASGWHLRDAAIRTRRGMADPPLEKPMAIKGWRPRPARIDWMRHWRDVCQA